LLGGRNAQAENDDDRGEQGAGGDLNSMDDHIRSSRLVTSESQTRCGILYTKRHRGRVRTVELWRRSRRISHLSRKNRNAAKLRHLSIQFTMEDAKRKVKTSASKSAKTFIQ